MALADLKTAAVNAILAGDWDEAETQLLAAQAFISTTPDTKISEEELKWRSNDLPGLLANVRRKRSEAAFSGGVQRSDIVRQAETSYDDC